MRAAAALRDTTCRLFSAGDSSAPRSPAPKSRSCESGEAQPIPQFVLLPSRPSCQDMSLEMYFSPPSSRYLPHLLSCSHRCSRTVSEIHRLSLKHHSPDDGRKRDASRSDADRRQKRERKERGSESCAITAIPSEGTNRYHHRSLLLSDARIRRNKFLPVIEDRES